MTRPFSQVDVFTSTPYQGNPVAVVLDGDGLSAGGTVTCVTGQVDL